MRMREGLILLFLVGLVALQGSNASEISKVQLVRRSQQALKAVANGDSSVKLLNYLDAQVRLRTPRSSWRMQ